MKIHFKKDENIFLISLFKHNINYICYTGINDRNEVVSFQFRISNNLQSSNYRIKKAIAGVTKKSDHRRILTHGSNFYGKN